MKTPHSLCLALGMLAASWMSAANAALDIQINFSGGSQFQAAFDSAASTWESLLVGYQDGLIQATSPGSSYVGVPLNTPLTTIYINATLAPNDGVGGVLGSAGPNELVQDAAGFVLTTDGTMNFDSADAQILVNNGTFNSVVLHEMAHVLGFGTLWEANGVYNANAAPGQYTGQNALNAWQTEFGQTGATFVDVETSTGRPGTDDGHWNENETELPSGQFSTALTGIADGQGRDMRYELMTGFLDGQTFISQMTVNSFIDIGFVGSTIAVPEASSFLFGGIVVAIGLAWKCRREQRRA